ncbi:MAG: hypothetical protein Ct9H300mP18_05280 [Candidatus Neomarinimicrobiota bacterium]|nr:MAG: hypothetical protein Ct9H300mP18_05280 [Candidatus Neomarinimicrobiota bacterium]
MDPVLARGDWLYRVLLTFFELQDNYLTFKLMNTICAEMGKFFVWNGLNMNMVLMKVFLEEKKNGVASRILKKTPPPRSKDF